MGKDKGGIIRMFVLNDGNWYYFYIIRKGRVCYFSYNV